MPNHIQNKLQIVATTKEVAEVREFLKSKEIYEDRYSPIDFNNIVPRDPELDLPSPPRDCWYMLFKEQHPYIRHTDMVTRFLSLSEEEQREEVELAFKYQRNFLKYGSTDWYDWSLQNWGTKWNAYSVFDERNTDDTIFFQTAWCGVLELMQKVSEAFPRCTFLYSFADEDTGSNTASFKLVNGEVVEEFIPDNGSNEAYELAFELHPNSAEYYTLIDGKYVYKEEE